MTNTAVQNFQNIGWKNPLEGGFSKRVLKKMVQERSILDIGCGDGLLMEELKLADQGRRLVGLDISPEALEHCKKKGLDCRMFDLAEPLPFPDREFEAVLLVDVLEHMFQPDLVLAEATRVVSDSVYISVPNFASLPARIQVLLGRIPENNTRRKGHVVWFTHRALLDLVSQAGLVVDEAVYNTFWEKIPVVGPVMKILARRWPSLFALSFVVRAIKK